MFGSKQASNRSGTEPNYAIIPTNWGNFWRSARLPLQNPPCPVMRGASGEMAEWLKAHAWKACVRETVPWVRIPLSPPSSWCTTLRHGSPWFTKSRKSSCILLFYPLEVRHPSPSTIGGLTALTVERAKRPGMYADGGGLYLRVTGDGTKNWVYRFMLSGRPRWMGLGPLHTIGLADARNQAAECRRRRHDGIDLRRAVPVASRRVSTQPR